MDTRIIDKIDKIRKEGYTDQQIADDFRANLSKKNIPSAEIDAFLDDHGLTPKLTPDQIMSGAASVEPGGEQYTAERFFNQLPMGNVDTASVMSGAAVPQPGEGVSPGPPTPFTRQTLPAAGDLLMSLLAKRPIAALSGPSLMGRMLGGVLRSGASGVGSGMGELAAQQAFGEPMSIEAAKNQMALGAGVGAVSNAVSGLVKPMAEFFANNTARAQGAINKIKGKMLRDVSQDAETFINDLAPDVVKGQTNSLDDISLKMHTALDEARAEYTPYKAAVTSYYDENGVVPIDNTLKLVRDMRDKIQADAGEKTLNRIQLDVATAKKFGFSGKEGRAVKQFLEATRDGENNVTPQQVNELLTTVFSNWDSLTVQERELAQTFKNALKKDLGNIPMPDMVGPPTREGYNLASPEFVGPKATEATAQTAKEAADESLKAVKRFNKIVDIYNDKTVLSTDKYGQTYLKPAAFAKLVYAHEREFTEDPVLAPLWPKLKQKADDYVAVVKNLTSEAMNPNTGLAGGWTDKIPFAPKLGEMSAYALLDPTTRATIQGLVKQMGPLPQMGLTLGSKMLGQEFGVVNPPQPPDYSNPPALDRFRDAYRLNRGF